jgi:protein translocase SEC61 complex gamma subunit, archaeal and eukaryotic
MAKKKGTSSSKPKKPQEPSNEGKKREGVTSKLSKPQEALKESRFSRKAIERKLSEYRRILTLTRRPTREEFSTIAKVAALGIIIIGVVGFLIYLAMVQVPASLSANNTTQNKTSSSTSSEGNVIQQITNATTESTSTSGANNTGTVTTQSLAS